MMWKPLSKETGVTDFAIAINGYVLFSMTYVKIEEASSFILNIFNHTVIDKEWR